ncbi:XAC2610-related protein [Acinetobacter sp. NCu2D-2]|uniref:XAC2610-related protein n=1 Tax=Acinetobacter sp. NCu2D-2 TaxID=1608473 RepID=UPI000B2F36C3|nr:hypothetical protein [Acinetobacter sp. NCu2D-2]
MKAHVLLGALAFTIPVVSIAQTTTPNETLQPLKNVKVSMQRMLKSNDGRYFLDLYAGIPMPHAHLTDTQTKKKIDFKGMQKGQQLTLRSYAVNDKGVASSDYALDGRLNIISSQFDAQFSGQSGKQNIQFGPAFKAVDKPALQFNFFGNKNLKRVDVINKANGKVMQTLTGFTAFPNTIGYLDINFDGYYDVVLSNLDGYKVEDKRFIYWVYNPKTRQFQRSPQMEKIIGFPKLDAQKKQIHYGEKVVYQVKDGLLNLVR